MTYLTAGDSFKITSNDEIEVTFGKGKTDIDGKQRFHYPYESEDVFSYKSTELEFEKASE
jgi:hypothetical protein